MSKDLRLVRLFSYDQRSYSIFEKRFRSRYRSFPWATRQNWTLTNIKKIL